MSIQYFTKERQNFINLVIETSLEIGLCTYGNLQNFANALGISKHMVVRLKQDELEMNTDVLFRMLQLIGALDTFVNRYLAYLHDLDNKIVNQRYTYSCDYIRLEKQMRINKVDYDPQGGLFKFKRNGVLSDLEIEQAKQYSYSSFVASFDGAVERRYALYQIVQAMRKIEKKYNVTHKSVVDNVPMKNPPAYVTLMRLYQPSGAGLETVDASIPRGSHDQTRTLADTFLAVTQIVPILVLSNQIEMEYLHEQ
ncbi:MAG: hypothetical protein Q9M92_10810 [Enterobacterales bacterium]|nr:hypothetical protein [Enterobacterales bacterium]